MVEYGSDDFIDGFEGDCKGAHKDIAMMMIEKGGNEFYAGMLNACCSGSKDMVMFVIDLKEKSQYKDKHENHQFEDESEHKDNEWDILRWMNMFESACKGGCMDIILFIIDRFEQMGEHIGETTYSRALCDSLKDKNRELSKFLLQKLILSL